MENKLLEAAKAALNELELLIPVSDVKVIDKLREAIYETESKLK